MAMRRGRAALLTAGTISAGLLMAGGSLAVGVAQSRTERAGVVESARIRKTPPSVAARGKFRREDTFVRDVYARLMRYDFAAREFHRIESRTAAAPGDYLQIALSDIRTERWTGQATAGPAVKSAEMLSIRRRELCYAADPCHAYYDVSWGPAPPAALAARQTVKNGDVTRVTRYRVTLRLGKLERTYQAAVLYQDERDGMTVRPEVLDPVIPDLDALAGDRAPLAKAPWNAYTKTRRYAAVVQKVRDFQGTVASRSSELPVGYLKGDETTAADEMFVALTGEPCEQNECQGRPNGTACSDAAGSECTVDKCQNGVCQHTTVTNVAAYTPDPEPLNTTSLTQETQDAITCLQNAVEMAGGTMVVTSGYRSQAYQDHLREVWQKWQLIKDWTETECNDVKTNVQTEWNRHGLRREPVPVSNHTTPGNAFDATVTLPPGQNVDTLASGCNLTRPEPVDDPVHFRR